MKIVRENINFERNQNPKVSIGIGLESKIRECLEDLPYTVVPDHYTINDDMTIDFHSHLNLIGESDPFPNGKLPDYIKFKKVSEDVDVDDCGLVSLEGFPDIIGGYFSCQMNNLKSLQRGPKEVLKDYFCNGNPGNFTEKYVKSICKVYGKIQADDTPDW